MVANKKVKKKSLQAHLQYDLLNDLVEKIVSTVDVEERMR